MILKPNNTACVHLALRYENRFWDTCGVLVAIARLQLFPKSLHSDGKSPKALSTLTFFEVQ
jgi:hypothetical protein